MRPLYEEIGSLKDIEAFAKARYATRMGFGKKPCVLVVDMTRGFVDEDSILGTGAPGRETVRSIARLLQATREKRLPIIYTIVSANILHNPAAGTVSRKRIDAVRDMLKVPRANEIVDGIRPAEGDLVLQKSGASAFFGTDLLRILVYHSIDTLIVTGIATSGCVRGTVVDAASYNYFVIVPKQCVADLAEVSHKVSLAEMDMRYADVLDLEEVMDYIKIKRLDTAEVQQ